MAAILQTKGGKALATGFLSLAATGGGLALIAATATTAKLIGVAIAFYGANGLAAAHTTYTNRRVTSHQFYSEWINETIGSAGAAISSAAKSVLSFTILSAFLRGFRGPRRRCHGHPSFYLSS